MAMCSLNSTAASNATKTPRCPWKTSPMSACRPSMLHFKPIGDPVNVHPESLRTAYFQLPAASLNNGIFSLPSVRSAMMRGLGVRESIRCRWCNPLPRSGINLIKSLLILWMMSVLVVSVCIFCSTFLSWPIAIVLSVVILLGHWGVHELGDATNSGIGNQVATDLSAFESCPGQSCFNNRRGPDQNAQYCLDSSPGHFQI